MEKVYYETTPAQDVSLLQLKYTLFKRVVNILTSSTLTDEKADWDLMHRAFNKMVERNDCMRIYFEKKDKQLVQYIREKVEYETPVLTFKTKDEQEAFVLKTRKKALDYMHGQVADITFINTWDGKSMVFMKVAHTILDMYGINNIYTDLFGVYRAMKNGTELPPMPAQYEEIIKRDLTHKKKSFEKDEEFFTEYLSSKPMPTYTGFHGDNSEIWLKRVRKGRKAMKMFFIHNDTESYMHKIDSSTVKNVMAYCEKSGQSFASFMLYSCQLTASLINHRTPSTLSLELLNCRGTMAEKTCGGTKAQSIMRYTTVDYGKSFADNFNLFTSEESQLYRHVGFPESVSEPLLHKIYNDHFGLMDTLYNCTFSVIPFKKIPGIYFRAYSNGKFPLPGYVAQMLDVDSNEIDMAYDCQTKVITEKDVADFHKRYVEVIHAVLAQPEKKLEEVFK